MPRSNRRGPAKPAAVLQFWRARGRVSSHRLGFAQIGDVIETVGLRVDIFDCDFGEGGFGQNLLGHVLDRAVDDFVNEADVAVFARGDPRDHLAPGHLGIDYGLAPTAAVIDHDDEILHASYYLRKSEKSQAGRSSDPEIVRTCPDQAKL